MKIKSIILSGFAACMLSSCAVTFPYMVTNNEIGTKIGTSSTVTFFSGGGRYVGGLTPMQGRTVFAGIPLNRDFGILEAAKKGKINKIGAVDLKVSSYVFFTKLEFIVSGE